jgi:hypothetical protein
VRLQSNRTIHVRYLPPGLFPERAWTSVFRGHLKATVTVPTDERSDHVDPPTRDELFASEDADLASALSDVDDLDLAAELVSLVDGLTLDAALDRVAEDPNRVRADVVRARTGVQ